MDGSHFDQFTQSLLGIGSRRRLLRLAGLLPLSAVLSTRTIDVATAGDVAADGSLGGRHGKNHRGRDNNRKHRKHDKHDKRKQRNRPGLGGGAAQHINVRLVVENQTSADIDFQGLSFREEQAGKVCHLQDLQTIHPTQAVAFQPDDINDDPNPTLDAYLNGRYGFTASQQYNENFPRVWAFYGWTEVINGCAQGKETSVWNHPLGVGQKVSVTMEGHQFEILRENDFEGARLIRIRALS